MQNSFAPAVLIAGDDPTLLDEVVRFLEEMPHWTVHAVGDVSRLDAAIENTEADAALISEGTARSLVEAGRGPLPVKAIVFGRAGSHATLRAALKLGAVGFVSWPEERAELKGMVESSSRRVKESSSGRLISVWSPKGGSGSSVIAAHLSASLAKLGEPPVLADLDLDGGDQAMVLGLEEKAKSLAELLAIIDKVSLSAIQDACLTHPTGFRLLPTKGVPGESQMVKPSDVVRLLSMLREVSKVTIADLASGISETNLAVFDESQVVLTVVTPGSLSLRRGREAIRSLASMGIDVNRFKVVLNQFVGGEVGVQEAAAIVGVPAGLTVRAHMELLRAPDRGSVSDKGVTLLDPMARDLLGLAAGRARLRLLGR